MIVLPEFSLRAGARVRVYTGKGQDTRHTLFLARRVDMWFAPHDTVHLYDARGEVIDSLRY